MSIGHLSLSKGFLPAGYVLGATKPPKENFTTPDAGSPARAEFLDYARKTPAERMREALLKRMGLDEEKLKSMAPAERQAVETQMRQLIEEQLRTDPTAARRPGAVADLRA